MAEFKTSRLRYRWRGPWVTATEYNKDDIVSYAGSSWFCVRQHTSADFLSEQQYLESLTATSFSPAWKKVTDGYGFAGTWAASTVYIVGNIVQAGGILYLCIEDHESSTYFNSDLAKWTQYLKTQNWRGNWTASTRYLVGDVIKYNGITYECISEHTSASTATGIIVGNNDTNDDSTAETWKVIVDNISYRGNFTASTRYRLNDLVKYGGTIFRCNSEHTSSATTGLIDSTKWDVEIRGFEYSTSWENSTYYAVGDIVRQGGYLYIANENNYNSQPGETANFSTGNPAWTVITKGINFKGEYASASLTIHNTVVNVDKDYVSFTTDDDPIEELFLTKYVSTDGIAFFAIQEGSSWTAGVDVTQMLLYSHFGPGASVGYRPGDNILAKTGTVLQANTTYTMWIQQTGANITEYIFSTDANYINEAMPADYSSNPATPTTLPVGTQIKYKKGDVVYRAGYTWVAIQDGIADGSTRDYLDSSNWEIVIPGKRWKDNWAVNTSYSFGDVVYHFGSTYECNLPHVSTNNNFPGDNGSGYFYWNVLVEGDLFAGLTTRGDLLTYNLSRELVGDGSTLNSTRVPIGLEDQLLVVEDNQGSLGYKTWGNIHRVFHVRTNGLDDDTDPDRGINYFKPYKTVRFAAEKANDGYTGTTSIKVYAGLYEEILPIVIPKRTAIIGEELRSVTIKANDPIAALALDSNYTDAALLHLTMIIEDVMFGVAITPTTGNTETQVLTPVSEQTYIDEVLNLIDDIRNYIDYTVDSVGTPVTVTGSNTARAGYLIDDTIEILTENKNFLAAEAAAYIALTFPAYTFDSDLCKRDIRAFIDSWIYDLRYQGNYKSILAARWYCNAILGSSGEDMFYCRDATGVRNLTVKGLAGELAPENQNELYQRPTGGSYVSLDPGWGPADEGVWITTRSPYIQNVTTFGTAAVGQKIDGSLHNGGNKSIVSNDFTQVVSDGIGAWVTNGGRAELVSVFTYYAHIGMFAEDGGIIRATNGNSSYGTFGAVADGNDPTETPQIAKVSTRNDEAVVARAFAGEVNDTILALEFENAGQEYTFANYTIVGSGTGAAVTQEEFRDNAIFNTFIQSNGTGYRLSGNNAQTGGTTTITLATNDASEFAEIQGMRIILTSGPGTGQYGYVQAYNSGTKVLTVYRESDDQPGWDHIVPGTHPTTLLTTATAYRIEPRPIFEDPGFSVSTHSLTSAELWANIIYGETNGSYNGLATDNGNAEFNIVKTGRTYSVTLANAGSGYSVNDVLVIDGSLIGGSTVEHDITITVIAVASGSIATFSYEGIAASGKFVITPSSGSTTNYSLNGENWTGGSMPSSGNWQSLAWGNNRFVSIAYGSANAAYSVDGMSWTAVAMPVSRNWNAVAYGSGVFVAVAGNNDSAAYSTDGTSWTSSTIPDIGDSTFNQWVGIAYGKGKFVAVANSSNAVAIGTYSAGTLSWTVSILEVQDSTPQNWVSIAYGNGRWVAVSSTGYVTYSFDGTDWYTTTNGMPNSGPTVAASAIVAGQTYQIVSVGTTDFTALGAASNTIGVNFTASGSGSGTGTAKLYSATEYTWRQIKYGQGVFFAVCSNSLAASTLFAATSYDGIVWTGRSLNTYTNWKAVAFGNPDVTLGDSTVSNSKPMWVAVPVTAASADKIVTGARALGRIIIDAEQVDEVRLWEPGSGYNYQPSLTIIDPNNTVDATFINRIADGVLAQPTFTNRGTNYKTSSTNVTITGDGFADIIPVGRYLTIRNLTTIPGPGAQIYIAGDPAYHTVVVTGINQSTLPDGTFKATFQISPLLTKADYIQDDDEVIIKERYSQVRITGHDFLDVGTGGFVETNYPAMYADYAYEAQPFNEVGQFDGGRVFYTSTDQDGNFRAGELFAVEQATGVVTISADFFNLDGLTELALGGIVVGGSGTVIREFSTDPLFVANSNNIVPTQKAIKSYLQSRLNIGGEDLLTASFIAGTVLVGPNLISNSAGLGNTIPVVTDFSGAGVGLSGTWLATAMFYRSFKDDGQTI